jgi:hypothetical protein
MPADERSSALVAELEALRARNAELTTALDHRTGGRLRAIGS